MSDPHRHDPADFGKPTHDPAVGPDAHRHDPAVGSDTEAEKPPRRSRQPILAVLAILAILLLALALTMA